MKTYKITIETKFPEDLYRVIDMSISSLHRENGNYFLEGEIQTEGSPLSFLSELHEGLSMIEAYILKMDLVG